MRFFNILISCVFVFILISAVAFAKPGPYVKVLLVAGKAEFLTAGKTDWEELKRGTYLYSGDSIKTYRDSSVEIGFEWGTENILSVRPNTHVVIKLAGKEKIELIDGEVYALVESLPKGSTFEIRTPTAVCGARGTGWGVKANKNRTTVSAYDKNSYAKGLNKDGSVMEDNMTVPEGFETIVERFMKPAGLTKISLQKVGLWDDWKNAILEYLSGKVTLERLAKNLEKIQKQKEKIEELHDRDRIDKRTEKKGAGTGTSGIQPSEEICER